MVGAGVELITFRDLPHLKAGVSQSAFLFKFACNCNVTSQGKRAGWNKYGLHCVNKNTSYPVYSIVVAAGSIIAGDRSCAADAVSPVG